MSYWLARSPSVNLPHSITMEVFQQVLVFSTVGYTFLLTDTDNIGNGTYTDISQFNGKNITDLFLQKCEHNNVSNIMEALQGKVQNASECSSKFVNIKTLESDVRKAMAAKTLDIVFQRYCGIWSPLIGCLNETILVLKQCLDEDEKYQIDVSLEILDYLQITLCSDGAVKFREFYTEGGLEYVQEEWEKMEKCIDTQKSIPRMWRGGNCQDFEEIRTCISDEMKKSNESGPAKAVDDIFELLDNKFCNISSNSNTTTSRPSSGNRSSVGPILLLGILHLRTYL